MMCRLVIFTGRSASAHSLRRLAELACLGLALTTLGGCDQEAPPSTGGPTPRQPPPPGDTWIETASGGQLLVHASNDESFVLAMRAAIGEARSTAHEAREQWQGANLVERENWLIKWAAPVEPTTDGPAEPHLEYVWVRPLQWSPFRIEGVLLSNPVGDIGVLHGALVAFPIEQLADWVYQVEGTMEGPRQGGFTVSVLEERYGPPLQEIDEPDRP